MSTADFFSKNKPTFYILMTFSVTVSLPLVPVKQFCELTSVKEQEVIFGVITGYFEECRLLGYEYPVRTSQEKHYVSATESSRLMLCKIWGFHGGDYEECRLLGYKNPICTSQETHYVSVTESSRLMLCKI
jgi:hypothetical protein